MNRHFLMLITLVGLLSVQVQAQQAGGEDSAYLEVVNQRSAKIVTTLQIENESAAKNVQSIIAHQYRNLNRIHENSREAITALKQQKEFTKEERKAAVKKEDDKKMSLLKQLHIQFIAQLKKELSNEQVDKVKDGMTYRVLPVTYTAYLDMIPQLTVEQKQQIYDWLTEARELAMDAGSSEEKHWWFGKYKGRINNYLSAAGYDLSKEREAWQQRIKERAAAKDQSRK